jgi:hypothetical protein
MDFGTIRLRNCGTHDERVPFGTYFAEDKEEIILKKRQRRRDDVCRC